MRNRNTRLSLAVLVAFAMTAGACSCEGDSNVSRDGKLGDKGFVPDPTKEANFLVDFGHVPLNAEPVRYELELQNIGSAALTIEPLAPEAPFGVTPSDSIHIPIDGVETMAFTYDPVEAGEHKHIATVTTSAGKYTFRLTGTGVTPSIACTPTTLDFGGVELGLTHTLEVVCINQTEAELELRAAEPTGNHAEVFTIEGPSPIGVKLEPGQDVKIPVKFTSLGGEGDRSASFKLWTGDAEVTPQITLKARTIAGALEVTPEPLVFGYVPEGATARRALTLRNRGSRPLIIEKPVMSPDSDAAYSIEGASPITLDVGQEAQVMVAFAPTSTGKLRGDVLLKNNSQNSQVVYAPVEGNGGGPQISCTPESIDFGVVAAGIPRTRQFVCMNVGTNDVNEPVADNLFISSITSGMEGIFDVEVAGGLNTSTGYAAGESFEINVTYAPTATGFDSTTITVASNDVLQPEITLDVDGEGKLLPPCDFDLQPLPRLDFARVTPGGEATLHFAVINNGADECVISDMTVVNDGEEVFSIEPVDAVTLPGATIDGPGELRFPVTFSPPTSANLDTATIFTGRVEFTISDPANPQQQMELRGASQKPCAEIVPSHLNFGETAPGCSTLAREFIIRNICSDPMTITSVEMSAGPSCPGTNDPNCEFGIAQLPPIGVVIPENDQVTFTVVYKPRDVGEDLGAVLVQLDDGSDDPYMATLQGRGKHDAKNTDYFEQAERPKVDLLWVIDNSGSMGGEQTLIGTNLTFFLDFAITENINFQLGVTSSDTDNCIGGGQYDHCGRLNPIVAPRADRILNGNSNNLSVKWANAVRTGTNGSATEKPLEGAKMALSPGMIDSYDSPYGIDDGNRGFLRHDAALSIIFVSDEPDSSPMTPNDYLTFFQGIKGTRNDNMLKIHGIVGPKVGSCSGPGGFADGGARYYALIEETDGVGQSICTNDWQATMQEIGKGAFGFSSRFFLSAYPACESSICTTVGADAEIRVEIDGLRINPTYQGNWVWKYDRGSNAVDFNPLYVPDAGSQVAVTYTQICR